MIYALNLSAEKRILSACVVLPGGKYDSMPTVEELPDGDITEYRYLGGQYIHDPLPKPEQEQPEPTPTLEDRVEALETTSDDIILMMAELIGG